MVLGMCGLQMPYYIQFHDAVHFLRVTRHYVSIVMTKSGFRHSANISSSILCAGPEYSKLTTLLVNISFKFQMLISKI